MTPPIPPFDLVLPIGVATAVCTAAVLVAGRPGATVSNRIFGLAGMVVLLATVGALGTASMTSLTVHVIQVTLITSVAAPALLLAVPRDAHLWVTVRRHSMSVAVAGFLLFNTLFLAWHIPAVLDASQSLPLLYSALGVALLGAALVFWLPIIGVIRMPYFLPRPAVRTLAYVLVALLPQTFGGITIALAGHPLYPAYALAAAHHGVSGISDQAIAGSLMAILTKVTLMGAFLVLFARLLANAPDVEGGAGDDDGGTRIPGPGAPDGQPRWYATTLNGNAATGTNSTSASQPRPSETRTASPVRMRGR